MEPISSENWNNAELLTCVFHLLCIRDLGLGLSTLFLLKNYTYLEDMVELLVTSQHFLFTRVTSPMESFRLFLHSDRREIYAL